MIVVKSLLSMLLAAHLLIIPFGKSDSTLGKEEYYNTYKEVIQEYIQYKSQEEIQKQEQSALKDTVKWINRVDWSDKKYGIELYNKLIEESGINGCLVDVTKAESDNNGRYRIYVTTLEGTASNKSEAKEQIKKDKSIVGQYMAVAFTAFKRDHPEVFWLSGKLKYSTKEYYREEESGCAYKADVYMYIKSKDFDIRSPEYQDAAKIKETIQLRDKLVDEIIQSSPSSDRYELLQHFNTYLIQANEYNTSKDLYSLNQDCYECISALKRSSGPEGPICIGYANAFKVLCDRANIPCVLVTGYTSTRSNSYHIWNYVQMEDKKWYAVDVTWNDALTKDKPNTTYFLIGADTKVLGKAFGESRTISNERLGIVYEGGPELSQSAYNPINPS